MRDDDIIYGSARAARLAARHAWRRLGHTLPFLREHPDVAEAVAEQLVASAGCSKEEHDRLSEHLLHILPADRARHWKRVYTERCVKAWQDRYSEALANYTLFGRYDNLYNGMMWMFDKGLLRGNSDLVGLLYIRREPWGAPSALFIGWHGKFLFAHLIHYHPLSARMYITAASLHHDDVVDFPDPCVRMDEMVRRLGDACGRPDWHQHTRRDFLGPNLFAAFEEQMFMLLALTRGDVGLNGVVAVQGVSHGLHAEMGLEVLQLAPDEYLVGANRRADWLALRDRAQEGA